MKSNTKTKKEYEQYLNNYYSGSISMAEAIDQLIYLTNKTRGKFVSQRKLESNWQNYKLGSLLRNYDPIAFNVGFNDWSR